MTKLMTTKMAVSNTAIPSSSMGLMKVTVKPSTPTSTVAQATATASDPAEVTVTASASDPGTSTVEITTAEAPSGSAVAAAVADGQQGLGASDTGMSLPVKLGLLGAAWFIWKKLF